MTVTRSLPFALLYSKTRNFHGWAALEMNSDLILDERMEWNSKMLILFYK